MQNKVYKIRTCGYVNMCGTADSIMLTQSVVMQLILHVMKVQQFNSFQLITVCVC